MATNVTTRLLCLDIDGTLLTTGNRFDREAHSAIGYAAARGFLVTYITGRGLPRLRSALAASEIRVPDSTLVGVEHGARIIEVGGRSQPSIDPLDPTTCQSLFESLLEEELEFLAFHPEDDPVNSLVWAPDPEVRASLELRFSNASYITGRKEQVLGLTLARRPAMITVRLRRDAAALPASATTWRSGNLTLVRDTETKGRALVQLMHRAGAGPASTLVVGDAGADASMLRLVPPRNRILVGPELIGTEVDEPDVLTAPGPSGVGRVVRNAVDQQIGS